MKKLILALSLVIGSYITATAQLADGTTAPDFTLTDINNVTHNLYTYLNQGKTVYIDFFAAHCPTCWAYHNTSNLKNLQLQYGPNGTINQDVVVIAIEYDANNGTNELNGISGVTQGNWVSGTPYPIINPEGMARTQILNNFNVVYYPMVYAICPDKKTKLMGTQSTATLYNQVNACASAVGISEFEKNKSKFVLFFKDNTLNLPSGLEISGQGRIKIFGINGQLIFEKTLFDAIQYDYSNWPNGIYAYEFVLDYQVQKGRLVK
jgi:thiol-disulfide isomerase/thioredoxin